MITDIDFKLIGVIDKLNQNIVQHYDAVIEHVNKIAEKENLKTRFTSLFELYRISVDTRQDLDKLKEKVWVNQNNKNKSKNKVNDKNRNERIGQNENGKHEARQSVNFYCGVSQPNRQKLKIK